MQPPAQTPAARVSLGEGIGLATAGEPPRLPGVLSHVRSAPQPRALLKGRKVSPKASPKAGARRHGTPRDPARPETPHGSSSTHLSVAAHALGANRAAQPQ